MKIIIFNFTILLDRDSKHITGIVSASTASVSDAVITTTWDRDSKHITGIGSASTTTDVSSSIN